MPRGDKAMKTYKVMEVNAPVFNDCPQVEAKTAVDAVMKAFNVKAKISGDFTLDYCVTRIDTGRRSYLKRI